MDLTHEVTFKVTIKVHQSPSEETVLRLGYFLAQQLHRGFEPHRVSVRRKKDWFIFNDKAPNLCSWSVTDPLLPLVETQMNGASE